MEASQFDDIRPYDDHLLKRKSPNWFVNRVLSMPYAMSCLTSTMKNLLKTS